MTENRVHTDSNAADT